MSVSSRLRRKIKEGICSNSLGNEIADMMGGAKEKFKVSCMSAVTANVREITQLVCPAETGRYERTSITVTADVADDTNQKYFILYDSAGSVGVYMENGAGGVPAGLAGVARLIKITTVATGDLIGAVGTKIGNALAADSQFVKISDDSAGTYIIEDVAMGTRADIDVTGAAGYTASVTVQGLPSVYNGKTIVLQDEAGSVGFWFDVDNGGTTIPAAATACDRAVEITTVANNTSTTAVGTAIYNEIDGDAKFVGTSNAAGTIKVRSTTYGPKTAGTAGTSATTVTVDTAGADSNYQGDYLLAFDKNGTVGFYVDVDNLSISVPTVVAACDRVVKIDTVTSLMTAIQAAAVMYTAIDADAEFVGIEDLLTGEFIIENKEIGAGFVGRVNDVNTIETTVITIGKADGGTLTTLAKKALQNSFCVSKNNVYYLEIVRVIEGGSTSIIAAAKLQKCKELLNVMLCDNASFKEVIALYA